MDCETRLSKFGSIVFSILFLAVSIIEVIGIFKDLHASTQSYIIPVIVSIFFVGIILLILFQKDHS